MINGRIHKASYKEFLCTETSQRLIEPQTEQMTNYLAYAPDDGTGRPRVGHLDTKAGTITPLSFASGTPIENLYQAIEIGRDGIIPGGEAFHLSDKYVRSFRQRTLLTLYV